MGWVVPVLRLRFSASIVDRGSEGSVAPLRRDA